jgi:hypothetical protein
MRRGESFHPEATARGFSEAKRARIQASVAAALTEPPE